MFFGWSICRTSCSNMPISFLVLLQIDVTCLDQVKSDERVTPRYLKLSRKRAVVTDIERRIRVQGFFQGGGAISSGYRVSFRGGGGGISALFSPP